MIIGCVQQPRPFKRKYSFGIGLDHQLNGKAWTTQGLWCDCLLRVNAYIGKINGKKFFLFIDNYAAHDNRKIFSELSVWNDPVSLQTPAANYSHLVLVSLQR